MATRCPQATMPDRVVSGQRVVIVFMCLVPLADEVLMWTFVLCYLGSELPVAPPPPGTAKGKQTKTMGMCQTPPSKVSCHPHPHPPHHLPWAFALSLFSSWHASAEHFSKI